MTTATPVKPKYLPPPVAVDCDSVNAASTVAWVWWGAGFAFLTWSMVLSFSLLHVVVTTVAMVLCGWIASREYLRVPLAQLAWAPTRGWLGQPKNAPNVTEPQPCTPQVVLDLQGLMLLRVELLTTQQTYWVWMRRGDAQQWHRMRCALFSARQP